MSKYTTIKRGSNPKKVIVKASGKQYDLYAISDGSGLYNNYPRGTLIVQNPLFNPSASEPFLYFTNNEVEIIEEYKLQIPWIERGKKNQENSGSESQER